MTSPVALLAGDWDSASSAPCAKGSTGPRSPATVSRTGGSFSLVARHLRGRSLDLGCADGRYLRTLDESSIGADLDRKALARARGLGLAVALIDANSSLPFPDSCFDSVLASHILEHVEAPIRTLREIARILRPSGHLILGLPIEPTGFWKWRRKYFGHAGHIYSFTRENMAKLFARTGFTPVNTPFHLPGIDRIRLGCLHGPLNYLPAWLLYWLCPAYWMVGRKIGPQ